MSNMSYCRFQNTADDLDDCLENLRSLDPANEGVNAREERRGRYNIIMAAARILEELGIDDPTDELQIEEAIADLDAGEGFAEDEE